MEIFDSHCHPQFPQYDSDRAEMIARALRAGVSMICVGTDCDSSKRGIELAQQYEGMWATIGVYPNEVNNKLISKLPSLEQLMTEPKVVAVGEVGLDYYRTPDPEKQKIQKDALKIFLDMTARHDKPIILHARDAGQGSIGRVHADMLEILSSVSSKLRGVAHSWTGTIEEAKKYLDLGFYLGFNGIITFTQQYDEVVQSVPLDRILLETDSPYLTPEPYRSQRNEPVYISEVAKVLARLKSCSYEAVVHQTTKNCRLLFRL